MYPIKQQAKIPTPLALLFLGGIIFGLSFLINKPTPSVKTQAAHSSISNLTVSNTTFQSATLYWYTDTAQTGWIAYGTDKNNLNTFALDNRDLDSKKSKYKNHYVDISDLQPNTTYYYKILQDDGVITDPSGNPFTFETASKLPITSNSKPAFGKVIASNGTPISAVVFMNVNGALPLTALSKDTTGEFLIPTYFLLQKDQTLLFPKDDTPVMISIVGEDGLKSQIKATFSTISPLQETIILGKDYDFTKAANVLGETTTQGSPLGVVDIIYPNDQAVIPASKPRYKGVAPARTKVTVTINQAKQIYDLTADNNGVWEIANPKPLSPGAYTVVVTGTDTSKKKITVSHAFTVLKDGEAVLGEATGPATLTPTVAPTMAPTITSGPTPTTGLTATDTPTPLPTYATTTITTTPLPSLPSTGGNITTPAIVSISLIFLGAGLVLLF